MIELIDTMLQNMETLRERAKGVHHQFDEMKKQRNNYQSLFVLEQESNEKLRNEITALRQKPHNPTENYQHLYEKTAAENETLLKALKGDLKRARTSLLIAELARRV